MMELSKLLDREYRAGEAERVDVWASAFYESEAEDWVESAGE